MKAAVLHKTGDSESLHENILVQEVDMPVPGDDEVIVRVHSASLNHRDLWIALGKYAKIKLPVIPGSDCAGEIHSYGKNVRSFSKGDEVTVNPSIAWGGSEEYQSGNFRILGMPDDGTLAEFLRVNVKNVFRKPAHLSLEEASALPLAGVTAYRALFVKGNVRPGINVLITGIGGAVASMAMMFCVAAGANVFVTSGAEEKLEEALKLGAKGGVSYKEEDWHSQILELADGKLHIAIDGAGGDGFGKIIEALSYGGTVVSYGATFGSPGMINMHRIFWRQLKILGSTMGSEKDFDSMLNFVETHKLRPVIDSILELEDIAGALQKISEGRQFGKIVIRLRSNS